MPAENHPPFKQKAAADLLISLALIIIFAAAAFFRFRGLDWGEYQYLHPDERFLLSVGTAISPVNSLSEYFDTANSSLNPHNRGYGFFVYGTLPIVITRYIVEWVFGHSGFQEMTDVGRVFSVVADLATIGLVFFAAKRLYNKRVAVLASAFSAAAVLQIQEAHFFTVDSIYTAFLFLAFSFAVFALKSKENRSDNSETDSLPPTANSGNMRLSWWRSILSDPLFLPCLFFGIALGLAVASKLNAVAVAITLPLALVLYLLEQPVEKREAVLVRAAVYLVMAAIASVIVFRLAQPYAFSGPGLFGVKPNQLWVNNIREQRAQSSGDVDFPPAMQWARRPIWFSFQNLVIWGLGLPLGILAWAGFLWMGWQLLTRWNKREAKWSSHGLIWGWTAIYFGWQSLQLNPTMRYQLPIYPSLAIIAAWAIVALYDLKKARGENSTTADSNRKRIPWNKLAATGIGFLVLMMTYAYAFAFTGIYVRPITRIAASRWIYQNIPGAITLPIQTDSETINQSLGFPYDFRITPLLPYVATFKPKTSGTLSQVLLPNVVDEDEPSDKRELLISINSIPPADTPLAVGSAVFMTDGDGKSDANPLSVLVPLNQPLMLSPDTTYNLTISLPFAEPVEAFSNSAQIEINALSEPGEVYVQDISFLVSEVLPQVPLTSYFQPEVDGDLTALHIIPQKNQANLTLSSPFSIELREAEPEGGKLKTTISLEKNTGTAAYKVIFDEPLPVFADEKYQLTLTMQRGGGKIWLKGTGLANEGDWDDGLPVRIDGYDGYAGIYPPDLNLNMYTDDNPEKLERFLRILDESQYILISSNRQWGTLPRIPERFPMITEYYRNLIGCPTNVSIETCYRDAAPGMYVGNLGFELVKTFTSEPELGPIHLNDQYAEEAFTVYDHPKVLIFKKTAEYSPKRVREILGSVDFSKIIRKPPLRYSDHPEDLMLPTDRWEEQQNGGTWSALFNTRSLLNTNPIAGVVVWYLIISLLGLFFYPLLRLALPGLTDRGYPLSRTAGMLSAAYLVWLAGSFRIPFDRTTISIVLLGITLAGFGVGVYQRKELSQEWQRNRRYILVVECLTLIFFAAFLLIRFGNPDLWHPWKGGEKPMDFSYFNAVLKSTTFPPYDPWFAGGYLNYYYFGFVMVGTLVKWLGITPAFAYNLILPTLFSMIAMGAFSLAWNLSQRANASRARQNVSGKISGYLPAISAALGMAVLGNLGIVKMIYEGYQKLGAPGGSTDTAGLLTRWVWALRGFVETLKGAHLQYGVGDWYWNSSRIIPAPGDVEPITEFPYFTVLYADLHAHLIALPLTLLALSFIISIVLGRARWRNIFGTGTWFALAGLTIGALRPTNTWDLPPYLAMGIAAVVYSVLSNSNGNEPLFNAEWWRAIPVRTQSLITALGGAGLLVVISLLAFQPYAHWYALGYTHLDVWQGTHTPIRAYLYHWGLFLIVIVPWMIWETRDWLAKTPLSSLRPYLSLLPIVQITVGLVFLVIALLVIWMKISIAWLVVLLAIWAGLLILRPNQPDAKRIVLFLVGSGLMLTLMVELVVLRGDIGRMNTVFKFYLQVWTMFAISAAAALGWLWPALDDWSAGWRYSWQAAFCLLAAGAGLFPLMGTLAKIKDRMSSEAPHTLDGMAFLRTSTYTDSWGTMFLDQDYQAIRWLQENATGSPVIVEANLRDLYRWGSRFSVYTGLPGVVGWEWHQQQQRTAVPGTWISNRILEVDSFYLTESWEEASMFLQKYGVRYIIVGQQERGHYPGAGLDKFEQANGILWTEVFRIGDTVIYQVNQAEP